MFAADVFQQRLCWVLRGVKLLWADRTNQYIGFQSAGDTVWIDPTYGLNEAGSTTGTCMVASTKISASNAAGACCSCNGATKKFAKSAWSTTTYICQ